MVSIRYIQVTDRSKQFFQLQKKDYRCWYADRCPRNMSDFYSSALWMSSLFKIARSDTWVALGWESKYSLDTVDYNLQKFICCMWRWHERDAVHKKKKSQNSINIQRKSNLLFHKLCLTFTMCFFQLWIEASAK